MLINGSHNIERVKMTTPVKTKLLKKPLDQSHEEPPSFLISPTKRNNLQDWTNIARMASIHQTMFS